MDAQRQLKIKTGVVKRTLKDVVSYQKEEREQAEKIVQMKADAKEEHDITKQVSQTTFLFFSLPATAIYLHTSTTHETLTQEEALGETQQMIRLSVDKLENACDELEALCEAYTDKDEQVCKDAKAAIDDARKTLSQ